MKTQNHKRKVRRFAHSFIPTVKLEAGKVCENKRHYRGVLRELIGALDFLADLAPERFVFPSPEFLAKKCKKFESKENYSKPAIEKGLKEFRARNIISKRLIRIRNGREQEGFIVAPHACLAVPGQGCCMYKGQLRVSGKWERSPGIPCEEHTGRYNVECPNCKPGVVFWAGYSEFQKGSKT